MMVKYNHQTQLYWTLALSACGLVACVRDHVLCYAMLAEVMQPDEVTLGKMMADSTIMEGFSDPEVMSAVAEIAQDPEAYSKHAAKVGSAYTCLTITTYPSIHI